jgi:hypothetical protein
MQHSAGLVALNLNHADVLRAERQIEIRRAIADQRADAAASGASVASASATPAAAVATAEPIARRHRRADRGPRLATR